jgi:hypothetical protein
MAEQAADNLNPVQQGRAPAPSTEGDKSGLCRECGREALAPGTRRSPRRYCSRACQQRAYRRSHAADYNARRRARRAAHRRVLALDSLPLSARETAMMAASAEEVARGEYVTSSELRARLGLRSAR